MPDKIVTAECPVDGCGFTAINYTPDETPTRAARDVQDHVNRYHTDDEIQSLGEQV